LYYIPQEIKILLEENQKYTLLDTNNETDNIIYAAREEFLYFKKDN